MTPAQFEAISRIMRRPGPARDAARLVLVDGMRVTDAARTTGVAQPSVSRAVKSAREAMELAKAAAGQT